MLALSRPGRRRQIAGDVSLSAGPAARRQFSRPGDDDRSPLEPPAPGLAARFPRPGQGRGHDLGPPSRIGRSQHLLLVLRNPAPAQHGGRQVGALEPQDPRRLDRHAGQRRHLCTGELGPVPTRTRRLGRARRPPLLDFALDPHARGLLPLSADLSLVRRGPGKNRTRR